MNMNSSTVVTQHKGIVCDVLVIGSGAAGLSCAITAHERGLDVIVVEKEPKFGGTTARSGGWLWIPGNSLAKKQGVRDTPLAAMRYIRNEAGAAFDPARVEAFLENGGPMVDFFMKKTQVQFALGEHYPDYHPDHPGGAEEGRSIRPLPYDGLLLGQLFQDLASQMRESTFMGMGLNSGPDLQHFLNATRSIKSATFVARRIASHWMDVLRHGKGTRLVNGNALAARLLASANERGIKLWNSTSALELIKAGGRVTGAVVARQGQRVQITARRGVVLAAGGFPHDNARRKRYFEHLKDNATTHVSLAPESNVGDGIRLAESVNASLECGLKSAAAWAPVSLVKYSDGSEGRFFHLIDRAKPGVIAVLKNGKRFVNESENYHDFVQAMIDACKGSEASAWMICDHRAIKRYGLGAVRPFPIPFGQFLKSGYLMRGATLKELANTAGIDAGNLERTVASLNQSATEHGVDAEFRKGSTSYQRLLGDKDFAPNPCIAPIKDGPFYAVRIFPGDLGTYHGIKTDASTRVLSPDGAVVDGLFAIGNDAASIFGGSYPGAGATLGPAMTFGFICGNHLADQPAAANIGAELASGEQTLTR